MHSRHSKTSTQGQTISFDQDPPTLWRGQTFPAPGSSAEWITEAGADLNGPQYALFDWGTASFANAQAYYEEGKCIVPGDLDENSGNAHMTAVKWNVIQTIYTRSNVD